MQFETDEGVIKNITVDQLREQLARLDPETNTRAILSIEEEVYLQTAVYANGYVVEKREGSADSHIHVVPDASTQLMPPELPVAKEWWKRLIGLAAFVPPTSPNALQFAEMERIFIAYLQGKAPDPAVTWRSGFANS